ncbi:MAG: DUF1583 domain-containing protein [Isosphaeraceae bacterium]
MLWWEDDQDESVGEFAKAAEAVKSDPEMCLTLAELYQQRGDVADALGPGRLVPAGRQRHDAAARGPGPPPGAPRPATPDRARLAAERLFGLRLDADTQLRLSESMHQLGMHELAEAVLSRARRRAGNKAAALVGLMVQYQRQDKADLAAQVAMQILRSTTTSRQANPGYVSSDQPDAARASAIQVLARSGRLNDLIAKTEEQVKRTPGSTQLHLTLADYYTAAGKRDQARAQTEALVKLRPDDLALRLRVAQSLMQEGQSAAAAEQYMAILKKDPAQLGRNSLFQVVNVFQNAGKTEELFAALEGIDLKTLGQPYEVMNLVQNLSSNPKNREHAFALFKKAWDAFPAEREQLFNSLYTEELWRMPGMYEYARQSIVPDPSSPATVLANQWYPFQRILSTSSDGTVTSLISRLLDLAAAQDRLGDLSGQIEGVLAKVPEWEAGKALQGLILCRQGRYEEAAKTLAPLAKAPASESSSFYADWVVGGELDRHVETRNLARTFFERSVNAPNQNSNRYEFSPMKRLVELYVREGRKDEARRILLSAAKPRESGDGYPPEYESQMRVQTLASIGQQLSNLGFVADAIPMLNETIELAENIPADGPNYIGNLQYLVQQARDGLSRGLQGLKGDDLGAAVVRMFQPNAKRNPSKDQAVDLALLVAPRELDKATVRSLFDESIAVLSARPNGLAEVAPALASAVEARPEDLSARTAAALLALASGDPARVKAELAALDRCLEKHPLEALPARTRANARQRAEAARLMPLWLVARACWTTTAKAKPDSPGRAEVKAAGDRLADRALAAASRQSDARWTLAMLRERGQLAVDRGDKAEAEAAWGRMLDQVLKGEGNGATSASTGFPPTSVIAAPAMPMLQLRPAMPIVPATPVIPVAPARPATPAPAATKKSGGVRPVSYQVPLRKAETPAPKQEVPFTKQAVPAAGMRPAAARQGAPNVPVQTVERFDQAMQIARLAAQNGLHALSLRAVRESLRGGPPIQVSASSNSLRTRIVISRPGMTEPADAITPRVVDQLAELDALWLKHQAPARDVYETLRAVVLPEARPTEIFPYAPALASSPGRKPLSGSAFLAAWASRAGQADDLRKALASRVKGLPQNELAAAVIEAQLALASRDDRATNAALGAIAARAKQDSLRSTTDLACHAALPALDRPATSGVALDLLDVVTKGFSQPNVNVNLNLNTSASNLNLMLARQHLKRGNVEAGRKRLEAYAQSALDSTSRFGGDYPIYLRKNVSVTVAGEYARAGLTDDALKTLGEYVDAPAYTGGDPPTRNAVPLVAAQLARRPASERYEKLRAWTLPTGDRRLVRVLNAPVPALTPPALFFGKEGPPPGSPTGMVSTATLLIDAAREAGKLDELSAQVEPLAALADRVENARELFWLVELARGRSEKVLAPIQAHLDATAKLQPPEETVPGTPTRAQGPARPFPMTEYLIARALAAQKDEPALDLGLRSYETLIGGIRRQIAFGFLARLQVERADLLARRAGVGRLSGAEGGLAHWRPASSPSFGSAAFSSAPVWVAHDGHVAHLGGSDSDALMFDSPLAGTYEFSFETLADESREGGVTQNGLVFERLGGVFRQIYPLGRAETLNRNWKLNRTTGFSRTVVRVTPESVRYYVNDHLVYEDRNPSPTSPWLGLYTSGNSRSVWKNLRITGRPEVPAEVRLTHADRLEGWVSSFYNESQPPRRSIEPQEAGNAGGVVMSGGTVYRTLPGGQPNNPDNYDWLSRDGVIVGRKVQPQPSAATGQVVIDTFGNESTGNVTPSRLYYARPLRDGDTLSYEFLYEPDATLAHPTLGRVAFLLEPSGVRLHWCVDGPNETHGLDAENSVDDPSGRLHDGPLPLEAGKWNAMTVAVRDGSARLSLNGKPIHQYRFDPENSRQFGLFHYKDRTAVRVRNVVLRGDWEKSLTPERLADLLRAAPNASDSPAERLARHAVIGEDVFVQAADDLLRGTEGLDPADRYRALSAWVLPTPDRPEFRLAGGFSPTYPATKPGPGGETRSPADAMVAAAKACGSLDELEGRVKSAKAEGPLNDRGRLALVGLIQAARGDDAGGMATLAALAPMLARVDLQSSVRHRWPEFVLAEKALERPALREAATGLIRVMLDQSRKQSPEPLWDHHVKRLNARVQELASADAEKSGPDASAWTAGTLSRPETRGVGEPPASWVSRGGSLIHRAGHAEDFLLMPVPLRGDFQVDCELTAGPGREIRLGYAGLAVGPRADGKALERSNPGRALTDQALSPPVEIKGEWHPCRLTVRNWIMAVYWDGRKIHESPVSVDGDPWLRLSCPAGSEGAARKVVVGGGPSVPDSLRLSARPDLAGWVSDDPPPSTPDDRTVWHKQGTEIIGPLLSASPGSKQEKLLRYHRPLAEDGEITYEFYYEPGKSLTHPALDRLAFLLDPEGVKVHWLTDSPYERTGLTPDNAQVEAEIRRGPASLPLKAKAWNTVTLSTTGETVKLTLNGTAIAERKIEPTNQRIFGLFHYADETEARVRNVVYRGQWGKTIPASLRGPAGGEAAKP